ncbi:MAG: formate/nitrite transporter family protein [Gammaproteobacteria bacterium]
MQTIDAYTPQQIAELVNSVGIKKAGLPLLQLITLGVLAGAFIAFGGMFSTLVITDSTLGFGPTRLLGGIAFSLGLILVIIAGAELFTGNNLIVIAWAERKITTTRLLNNWVIVFLANFIGALASAWFVSMSGSLDIGGGAVAETAANIARAKVNLDFSEALIRGLLCNALVCLAVWLSYASHDASGKILAIIFPISAFVALGFEHSIANMYLIGVVIFEGDAGITFNDLLFNLVPVTIGNIIGGSIFVALVYWICYLRDSQ